MKNYLHPWGIDPWSPGWEMSALPLSHLDFCTSKRVSTLTCFDIKHFLIIFRILHVWPVITVLWGKGRLQQRWKKHHNSIYIEALKDCTQNWPILGIDDWKLIQGENYTLKKEANHSYAKRCVIVSWRYQALNFIMDKKSSTSNQYNLRPRNHTAQFQEDVQSQSPQESKSKCKFLNWYFFYLMHCKYILRN